MIGCKEATLLTIKDAERKTTIVEKLKLLFHLMMCEYCRRFKQQNKTMDEIVRKQQVFDTLPETLKFRLKKELNK